MGLMFIREIAINQEVTCYLLSTSTLLHIIFVVLHTLNTKNFGRFNFRTRYASEKLKRPKFLVSENLKRIQM